MGSAENRFSSLDSTWSIVLLSAPQMHKTKLQRCKMLRLNRRSTAQSIVAAFLIVCLFSLSGPIAAAAESPQNSDKSSGRDVSLTSEVVTAAPEAKVPRVLFAAYEDAIIGATEPGLEAATRPRSVAKLVESVNAVTTTPLPPPPPQVASTAPMTAGEKFGAWFRSKFMSFGPFGSAVFNGMWKELNDNDDFKEDTVDNFFADSMTRAARSYASATTNAFYEKALLASLFRQDPRYHRSGKTGAGARIVYAATRVFITQGDRCECHQFNASFLLGGAAGALTANLWERRERTGPWHTFSRYYNHIGMTALFNVVREFVSGQ